MLPRLHAAGADLDGLWHEWQSPKPGDDKALVTRAKQSAHPGGDKAQGKRAKQAQVKSAKQNAKPGPIQ